MPDELSLGEGALPDSSATAGTPDLALDTTDLVAPPDSVEDKTISDELAAPAPSDEDISEDLKAEMESAIKSDPNDSQLVKKLRDLVKTKYEEYSSRQTPQLSEDQQKALELAQGLFEFDVNRGTATTQNFAKKLAERDPGVAEQAFKDLANIAIDQNGFTLAHKFLQEIGLDPYKIEELRQFSRGEISGDKYGVVEVHENVPANLAEAYKSLDPVTRVDVDVYLDSSDEGQVRAAMSTLRDRQARIDSEKRYEYQQTQLKQQFETEVSTATLADLDTTYSGLLTTLKSNPAYTSVAISSDKSVDTMVKDSVIAQLNALGDPRSVLAKQAVQTFESQGVKVDLPKIEGLMRTIEDASRVAISAERMGKMQGRDYSTQIQEALARKTNAVTQLVALGNKYFSQTLSKLSGVTANTASPKGAIPSLDGLPAGVSAPKPGILSEKDLDASIAQIAGQLQAGV